MSFPEEDIHDTLDAWEGQIPSQRWSVRGRKVVLPQNPRRKYLELEFICHHQYDVLGMHSMHQISGSASLTVKGVDPTQVLPKSEVHRRGVFDIGLHFPKAESYEETIINHYIYAQVFTEIEAGLEDSVRSIELGMQGTMPLMRVRGSYCQKSEYIDEVKYLLNCLESSLEKGVSSHDKTIQNHLGAFAINLPRFRED